MPKFKPSRPLLARPPLRPRVVPAPVATQRLVAPVVVKPILPPKPKLRPVLRPIAKPLIRAGGPTHRGPVPPMVRPAAPPVVRAGIRPTQRIAARSLVRPVEPPAVRLRNVLRPVAKPLAPVPPAVRLSRVTGASAPPVVVVGRPAAAIPSVVPVISPPQPAVRMNLRTGTPIVDAGADPRRLIRYVTPAAADFLAEYEDTVAGGTPHGFLRLVRSQYAGPRSRRAGYGAAKDTTTDLRYKVTNDGKVWEYDYLLIPSEEDNIKVIYPSKGTSLKSRSSQWSNIKDRTVSAHPTYDLAVSAAKNQSGEYSPDNEVDFVLVDGSSTTTGTIAQTGYYKDTGGWAWYYNASGDYLEAIAAPKGKYSTQPKFTSSTSGFSTMKANIAKSGTTPVSRSAAIANAAAAGGVELPQSSRSSSGGGSVQTQAPADKLAAGGGDDKGFSLDTLTQQVWFWPVAILVPTAAVIAGILLIPSKKKPASAAAPAASTTLVPA